ncbi:hypothetical protein EVA_17249 [gut metagenome]|uniref:Uncharacterized protein n=1 Tax=gut metagenome TaxID=749906 RepID=J9FJQ5_9ZZZZ
MINTCYLNHMINMAHHIHKAGTLVILIDIPVENANLSHTTILGQCP